MVYDTDGRGQSINTIIYIIYIMNNDGPFMEPGTRQCTLSISDDSDYDNQLPNVGCCDGHTQHLISWPEDTHIGIVTRA